MIFGVAPDLRQAAIAGVGGCLLRPPRASGGRRRCACGGGEEAEGSATSRGPVCSPDTPPDALGARVTAVPRSAGHRPGARGIGASGDSLSFCSSMALRCTAWRCAALCARLWWAAAGGNSPRLPPGAETVARGGAARARCRLAAVPRCRPAAAGRIGLLVEAPRLCLGGAAASSAAAFSATSCLSSSTNADAASAYFLASCSSVLFRRERSANALAAGAGAAGVARTSSLKLALRCCWADFFWAPGGMCGSASVGGCAPGGSSAELVVGACSEAKKFRETEPR